MDNNTETNEVRHTLSPYIKTNAKWLKDLKIRNDSIKLEEITGKTFSDINHANVFLGQSPEGIEITKINKWDLMKQIFTQQRKT